MHRQTNRHRHIHSLTHSLTHSLSHSLTHSLTLSLTHTSFVSQMLFMALGAVTLVLLFASAVPKVPPPPPRCALRVGNGKWMSDMGGGRDCNKFPSAGCAANW